MTIQEFLNSDGDEAIKDRLRDIQFILGYKINTYDMSNIIDFLSGKEINIASNYENILFSSYNINRRILKEYIQNFIYKVNTRFMEYYKNNKDKNCPVIESINRILFAYFYCPIDLYFILYDKYKEPIDLEVLNIFRFVYINYEALPRE